MSQFTRRLLFVFFFLSGFCGLVYQVVWTRLAFASFGIITPVLSVVISVFMLGLAVGAWAGGKWIGWLTRRTHLSAIFFYALTELVIGTSAFVVPALFGGGEKMLWSAGQTDSFGYLALSALVLALSIFPWCFFMGTTFPFVMAYVREQNDQSETSFSYLYLANVLGAMSGTLLAAIVLVEIFGFKHTLWIAAGCNFIIALMSASLFWRQRDLGARVSADSKDREKSPAPSRPALPRQRLIQWVLFASGFSAMAMEVVWARSFTPVMKTQVYSFAMILFAYLCATFFGSWLYRRDLRRHSVRSTALLFSILSIASFLPILFNDGRFLRDSEDLAGYLCTAVLLVSICPLCGALGYLTPSLIDEVSLGDPARAGKAYAVNVVGCVLGPLFASYVLLPWLGERYGLIVLSLPFLVFFAFTRKTLRPWYRFATAVTALAMLLWSTFFSLDFVGLVSRQAQNTQTRRDYAASVVSAGQDRHKYLFVNGIGMTALVPITKFMVHLPLGLHTGKAESALIICFGMGTSYRSALSWNIETTAVELVPSVKNAFPFYHADAASVLGNPKGRIVVDDGRRYLKRIREKFDIIIIDPPPPVQAAGSSLLYSEEFYEEAKRHLKPYGILQAWYPDTPSVTEQAVVRSAHNCFPYVRCFRSMGERGMHILASMEPIEQATPEQLAAAMPTAAGNDLLEWSDTSDLPAYLWLVLSREISPEEAMNPDPKVRITDDHPYNEYFLLRRCRLL